MNRIPDIDEDHLASMVPDFIRDSGETDTSRVLIYPDTYLKLGDDVTVMDIPEFTLRMVCLAGGVDCVGIYYPAWFGDAIIPLNLPSNLITDRAPLDPNETPMPIFPEE